MAKHPYGGRREGAGRKPGSNRYGEPTTPVRVPRSCLPAVQNMLDSIAASRRAPPGGDVALFRPADNPAALSRPLFSSVVSAGFPSPAEDYVEGQLDLNEYLVAHPSATFFVRVSGDSMIGAGIFPGDILVVDRSLPPAHKSIVIAVVDNELTVKRLWKAGGVIELRPENPAYAALTFRHDMELVIWGVVAGVTRKL